MMVFGEVEGRQFRNAPVRVEALAFRI